MSAVLRFYGVGNPWLQKGEFLMTVNENDFVVAMEECSEVAKCLSKAMRFGLYNHHPSKPEETNAQALIKEYYQLNAIMERIINSHNLKITDDMVKQIKLDKLYMVDKYANVSIKEGRIS